jgi:DNA mismatch repair protein MutS
VAEAAAISATADALARIDVAAGLAERAAEADGSAGSRHSPCLEIEAGRHPVVERALAGSGDRFVANDCCLGPPTACG